MVRVQGSTEEKLGKKCPYSIGSDSGSATLIQESGSTASIKKTRESVPFLSYYILNSKNTVLSRGKI